MLGGLHRIHYNRQAASRLKFIQGPFLGAPAALFRSIPGARVPDIAGNLRVMQAQVLKDSVSCTDVAIKNARFFPRHATIRPVAKIP